MADFVSSTIAGLESTVDKLSKSVGEAVQASVDKRTQHIREQLQHLAEVQASINAKCDVINEGVNDKIALAVDHCRALLCRLRTLVAKSFPALVIW